MMSKKIGIVTVLYNSDDVLEDFFKSLSIQTGIEYKLYVIDNSPARTGSDLCKMLSVKYQIDIDVVFNDQNVGVAAANNQGIDSALRDECDYILLSNNDIEFKDEKLISSMCSRLNVVGADALVPKMYYHSEPNRIWCAGGYINRMAVKSPHYGDGEIDEGQCNNSGFVEYAPTCFMLIDSKAIRAVGMMDEKYFVYYDDTDYILRFNKLNKKLYYYSEGSVWHKVSYSTGGADGVFSLYYTFRNRIYFIRKNYGVVESVISTLYVFGSALVKIIKYDRQKIKAIFRGLKAGFSV